MSASDKKKLRKEQATAYLTEKQRQEQAEAKKLKLYTIGFVSILVVVACIAIGVLGVRAVNQSGVFEKNTIAAVVDGGPSEVGVESTIVDLTGEVPRLLRPGGITPEELLEVLGELEVDEAVLGLIDPKTIVRAPGMKYIHYSPTADVIIVSGKAEAAAAYVKRHFQDGTAVLCFTEELPLFEGCNPTAYGSEADIRSLSAGLFSALRDLDKPEIKTIYARCPEGGGVAYAVGNRLKKAAGFHVVDAEVEP